MVSTGVETDYYMSFNSDETNGNYRYSIFQTLINGNKYIFNGDTRFIAYDNTDNSSVFVPIDAWIIDYARTDWYKQVLIETGWFQQTPTQRGSQNKGSLMWESNSAISSIKISPTSGNFKSGCRLSLYGVKG